jgi:monothiol glutaredoxin
MNRSTLSGDNIHPKALEKITSAQASIVAEVEAAAEKHAVLVVGMSQNPFPRKVRALLAENGIAFEYLNYGSYFSLWRPRLALKMWTGWPTFPMVFVKGVLVGGFEETKQLLESGELKRLLSTAA